MIAAREAAMNLLAMREHSQQELRRKLRQKSFAEDQIETAIAALAQEGLQSDERFTETFIRSRKNAGHGPLKIRNELQQRGINDALISTYLNEQDEQWWEAMIAAWQKKFTAKPEPYDQKNYGKQARFLMQRGFATDAIRSWLLS